MQTRVLLTIFSLLVALWQGAVQAQVPTTLPEQALFTFGKAQFYPLYAVELAWTDNLYYQSDDILKVCAGGDNAGEKCTDGSQCPGGGTCEPTGTGRIATTYASLTPGFVLDLPFSQSHSRIGYVYDYRGYTQPHTSDLVTVELPSQGNHYFVGETELQFANGGRLAIRDDFQRGALSAVDRDPTTLTGSVVDFTSRDDRFRANNAGISLGHSRSEARSIDLSLYSHVLDFLGDARFSYFDVDSLGAVLSGAHQVKPRVRVTWELGYDQTDLFQEARSGPPDERSLVEQSWKLGGVWQIAPGSALDIKAGWQQNRDRAGPDDDSRSLTGSLLYVMGVPGGLQLATNLVRDVYTGVYGDNDNFLENRIAVSLSNDANARLVLAGRVTYSTDHFEDPLRDDRTVNGELSVGYRLGRSGVLRFYARGAHRNSEAVAEPGQVLPDFGFDVKTVGFTLGLGD